MYLMLFEFSIIYTPESLSYHMIGIATWKKSMDLPLAQLLDFAQVAHVSWWYAVSSAMAGERQRERTARIRVRDGFTADPVHRKETGISDQSK